MKFSATILAVASIFVSKALAHGGVTAYVIGGKEYPGFQPYNSPNGQSTIQWRWDTYDPLYQASDSASKCNKPGTGPAAQVAEIAAGSTITAKWKQWTHQEGPVLVYMARVGNQFSASDGNGKVWFKIDQAGLLSGTISKGKWGAGQVIKTGQWTSTIPANLAPGNYLIRHELIALHQANAPQFYPECAQLKVTGSGTGVPSGEYLASFPGTYKQSDPGINVDVYTSTSTNYILPGPKVWTG
ncbi:cellulose-growth-specific protein [Ascobolus immersus RN42]|uniref:AA9 family lytic polysaccharide monooxygenase n=1 Tax=Ascobolus immersus RN42 TaxID=1160509 RepID=A0A3N4HRP1_ASCIM|nr:cellulose-growth-specific protein [Ascobolus immersus RN42]